VAVAIGKLDALFYILGIFGGIFLFGITAPGFAKFNVSGAMGSLTLPVWLNLNTGIGSGCRPDGRGSLLGGGEERRQVERLRAGLWKAGKRR